MIVIKNKISLSAIIFIIFIIVISSLLSGCTNNSGSNNTEYIEAFSFLLLTEEEKNTSDYAGKVVIIDFTAVNCPYCVPQTFVLEKIYNDYSSNKVVIISIYAWMYLGETLQDIENLNKAYNCKSPCTEEETFPNLQIREFKEYYGKQDGLELNWIIGMDDIYGTLFYKYPKVGVPYILILDKKGNIYYSKSGYTDYNKITNELDNLIK